jgi:hypothetical protein
MLAEARAGSATPDVRSTEPIHLTDAEIRERMSGNHLPITLDKLL